MMFLKCKVLKDPDSEFNKELIDMVFDLDQVESFCAFEDGFTLVATRSGDSFVANIPLSKLSSAFKTHTLTNIGLKPIDNN